MLGNTHTKGRKYSKEERAKWKKRWPDQTKHPQWKGGKTTLSKKYVGIKDRKNPMAGKHGYVREHRLVVANHLGRPLRADEEVHHLNGDTRDNRLENLVVLSKSEHSKISYNNRIIGSNGRFV